MATAQATITCPAGHGGTFRVADMTLVGRGCPACRIVIDDDDLLTADEAEGRYWRVYDRRRPAHNPLMRDALSGRAWRDLYGD